ncbi:hypothetical protein GGR53DRAFT_132875 [Hypoxylon sp. FL1150]|nr:hypothetical protein GGR53DRAFT_132875 [Hypoxylon sp. FL1150]
MGPSDAGESSQSTSTRRLWINKSNSPPSDDKRQHGDGKFESDSIPDSYVKIAAKKKKHRSENEYSCPYRKYDPTWFNVRDYENCANRSYQDMPDLKKHLLSRHYYQPKPFCGRCGRVFETQDSLIEHYKQCTFPPQPNMNSQPQNLRNGFGSDIADRLRSRGTHQKVDRWEYLYTLLFPNMGIPDSGFVPVVEDHDVARKCENNKDKLRQDIRTVVARQSLYSAANYASLSKDITSVLESFLGTILKCPRPTIQSTPNQQSHLDCIMHQSPDSLEGGFIDVPMERNHPGDDTYNFDPSIEIPTYLTQARDHSMPQGGMEQWLDASQTVWFPSAFQTPQGAAPGFPYVANLNVASLDDNPQMANTSSWFTTDQGKHGNGQQGNSGHFDETLDFPAAAPNTGPNLQL